MIHVTSEADLRAYTDGGWFEARDGTLYVIPLGERELWGPDDAVMARLVGGSWETTWPELMRHLSLELVPYERRRWAAGRGFYKEK